jgi:lipopolysaccharide biosynthesis glycosyltransferase
MLPHGPKENSGLVWFFPLLLLMATILYQSFENPDPLSRGSVCLPAFSGVAGHTDLAICWTSDVHRFPFALLSIFTTLKVIRGSPFCIHYHFFLYAVTLDDASSRRLAVLCQLNPDNPLQLHTINQSLFHFSRKPTIGWGTPKSWAAFARFMLPTLLPEAWIFYLDADTLCYRDFVSEARVFVERSPHALVYGTLDEGVTNSRFRTILRKYGINPDTYIATGVLLMRNGARLRQMFADLLMCVQTRKYGLLDQDCLNSVGDQSIMALLPNSFNCHWLEGRPGALCTQENLSKVIIQHGVWLPWRAGLQRELDAMAGL